MLRRPAQLALSPGSGKCSPLSCPCQDRVIVSVEEKRPGTALLRAADVDLFLIVDVERDVQKPSELVLGTPRTSGLHRAALSPRAHGCDSSWPQELQELQAAVNPIPVGRAEPGASVPACLAQPDWRNWVSGHQHQLTLLRLSALQAGFWPQIPCPCSPALPPRTPRAGLGTPYPLAMP